MHRVLVLGLVLPALALPAAAQVRPTWPAAPAPASARSVVVRVRPAPPRHAPPRPLGTPRPESRVGEALGMLIGVTVGGVGGYVVGRAATGDPLGGLFCLPAGLVGLVVGGVVGAEVGPVRRPAADTAGVR